MLASAAAIAIWMSGPAAGQGVLPGDLVYLRDVDPSIIQDIRYATSNNFVGRPLPGYDAPECILRRAVAAALRRVQTDLAASGLSLKVYDCYRPTRAVRAMAQWAGNGRSPGATKRFFPNLPKNQLFALGYIAARSKHSTGIAVDLTMVETGHARVAAFDPRAAYGPCTGPAAARAPDTSIDMGTGFDCLDVLSHTASPAIRGEARRHRDLLVAAMARRGFRNYHREWWHFEYAAAAPVAYYDAPIRARVASPD
jgi:D-alanyl-D-alanine dipeptidase